MPEAQVAKHLTITGRVQGVSYRACAQAEARRLGLCGWVRNRRNGSVEAVACGSAEAVQRFVAWAWQGPGAARVDEVVVDTAELPSVTDFEMRPTV